MKKVLRWFVYLLAYLLLAALIISALNFTYLKRTFTFFSGDKIHDINWFEPKVDLKASNSPFPVLISEKSIKEQETAFSDALSYAESMNSSALLVWQGGELVVERYWPGYDAGTFVQTNSIHKSVLSLLVGIAVSEGAIESIQDPVSKYLGDWIDQPYGQVSIEHLLTMTSGLGKEKAKLFIFDHTIKQLHSSDISAVAQSLPQSSAPGERFNYIGTNPQLLIDVLEAATGEDYETYLEEKFWSKVAANPAQLWMDRKGGVPHGACCLISTAEDLLRVGLLILNNGHVNGEQVVPAEWIQAATSPSKSNPNYGYLIWRGSPYKAKRTYGDNDFFSVPHSEPYLADDVLFFDGFGGQRVYIVPSKDLVIVRVGETRFDFDDSILPNRIIESIESNMDLSGEISSGYKVTYADLSIEVSHAQEPLALRVSYPEDGEGVHPLVLFSHGHYLTNDAYHHLTDKWVEQGYVVVAPQHMDTGEREYVNSLSEKYGSDWVSAARPIDMTSTLDQIYVIASSLKNFQGKVRTDKVIAAGHSMGALSAQYMAGAFHEKSGNSIYPIPESLQDDRITAVVAISPPGLMQNYLSKEAWQDFSTPQLVVTGTRDVFESIWPDYRAHFVSYEVAQPGDNYLLVFDGVDHYFGNLLGRLEREEESQSRALQDASEISLLFMNTYLNLSDTEDSVALNNFTDINARSSVDRYERR